MQKFMSNQIEVMVTICYAEIWTLISIWVKLCGVIMGCNGGYLLTLI